MIDNLGIPRRLGAFCFHARSKQMPNDDLFNALESVLGKIVVASEWHAGKPISDLRRCIRFHVLDEIKVKDIHERLANLPVKDLDTLIDRLELEEKFPDAK